MPFRSSGLIQLQLDPIRTPATSPPAASAPCPDGVVNIPRVRFFFAPLVVLLDEEIVDGRRDELWLDELWLDELLLVGLVLDRDGHRELCLLHRDGHLHVGTAEAMLVQLKLKWLRTRDNQIPWALQRVRMLVVLKPKWMRTSKCMLT